MSSANLPDYFQRILDIEAAELPEIFQPAPDNLVEIDSGERFFDKATGPLKADATKDAKPKTQQKPRPAPLAQTNPTNEALRKLQQRLDAAVGAKGKQNSLLDIINMVILGRAAGIPLSELQGLVKRQDLIDAGLIMSPQQRREDRKQKEEEARQSAQERAENRRKEREAARERSQNRAQELRDQRLGKGAPSYKQRQQQQIQDEIKEQLKDMMDDVKKPGMTPGADPQSASADYTPSQARMDLARSAEQLGNAINDVETSVNTARLDAIRNDPALADVLERYDPNFVGAPRPQAGDRRGPDNTPIDVEAENQMMMRDILDFGPTPQASGPVGQPRDYRAVGPPPPAPAPRGGVMGPNPAAPSDGLTPSQRLALRQTPREEFEAGRTRVAPGAVGSAPTQPGGPATGQPRTGFALEERGGIFVPTEAAKEAARYARGETSGMSGSEIDELEQSLKLEVDELKKKDRVGKLMDQRESLLGGIQARMRQGQRASGVPVDHGFRHSFDQNVRQPLRGFLGMGG
tara:strand:- start:1811 stop:3370 length:1560 start_codon:yes stop_codon:yes gene_type:complete